MPYLQIADLLREKYNLSIQAPAIFKFVKAKSHGRKEFIYGRIKAHKENSPSILRPTPKAAHPSVGSSPRPVFEFPYSERYNLHRLPPEEAAARRKKLEEEGH